MLTPPKNGLFDVKNKHDRQLGLIMMKKYIDYLCYVCSAVYKPTYTNMPV